MENVEFLSDNQLVYLPIKEIKPNPFQSRKFSSKASLIDLSNSIKKFGVLQPIIVRLINNCSYEIVTGERRLRASQIVGLETIPAIIMQLNDYNSAQISLIENLHRDELNYIEAANGLISFIDNYSLSHENLAKDLCKDEYYIMNKIRLLALPKSMQKIILENDVPEEHAMEILKLPDENSQLEVLNKIIYYDLTKKTTKSLVQNVLTKKNITEDKICDMSFSKMRKIINDIRVFVNTIKAAVAVMQQSGFNTTYSMNGSEKELEINIKVNLLKHNDLS